MHLQLEYSNPAKRVAIAQHIVKNSQGVLEFATARMRSLSSSPTRARGRVYTSPLALADVNMLTTNVDVNVIKRKTPFDFGASLARRRPRANAMPSTRTC